MNEEEDSIRELQGQGLVVAGDTQSLRDAAIKNFEGIIKDSNLQLLRSEFEKVNEAIQRVEESLNELTSGDRPRSVSKSETRLKDKLDHLKERREEIEGNIAKIEFRSVEFEEERDDDIDSLVRTGEATPFHLQPIAKSRDPLLEHNITESVEREAVSFSDEEVLDDADDELYVERIKRLREKQNNGKFCGLYDSEAPSIKFDGGYKVPLNLYSKLFPYQRTCLNWLWELYCQRKGGIVGDEMGLGKTVQVVSYFAGLHFSDFISKPILIVCPATVLFVWVKEIHNWWPMFRACVVHTTGSAFRGSHTPKIGTYEYNEADDNINYTEFASPTSEVNVEKNTRKYKQTSRTYISKLKNILKSFCKPGNIVITTYGIVRSHTTVLNEIDWDYAVLDEGHQIRNPDAEITIACKRFRTSNRLILTGTPIQNNLIELWSLYDFIIPGKLGTLPVFRQQFAVPISIGGYATATKIQAQTAYECAKILRELVSPYLLLRLKVDVAKDLPGKEEKVLFCRLTSLQRAAYEKFLREDLDSILSGKRNALYGIDILRKICNHPDLLEKKNLSEIPDYGHPVRSGKLTILGSILHSWREKNNRALIFCQTQQMLNIIEKFVRSKQYTYLRMDGKTPVHFRHSIIDKFNNSSSIFLFLLSTRVGGIGLNLTGANCVLIYDPDWNPSTDMQAQERSWRIGQRRDVTVYRLLTTGTVEEKVYHRQIFKQFLANRILKNPLQNKFFKINNLRDIFTLSSDNQMPDTHEIFVSRNAQKSLPANENALISDKEVRAFSNFFSNESLHTVFAHDRVVEAMKTPADNVVDEEVSRIAKTALKSIQLNSEKIKQYPLNFVPTWTGHSGVAGQPPRLTRKRSRFDNITDLDDVQTKISRTNLLLTKAHATQVTNSPLAPSSSQVNERITHHSNPYYNSIKHRLISLFSPQTKSCLTSDIVRAIGPYINESNAKLIKKALREVAHFVKDSRSTEDNNNLAKNAIFSRRGAWKLRQPGVSNIKPNHSGQKPDI